MTLARGEGHRAVGRCCAVAVALAAAVIAIPAGEARAAEPAQESKEMRAERLFRSGEKKFDSGKYAEACDDFGESLRLGPKLGTLLNLALCHETVGKLATAWREFHHAAAWAAQNNQRDRHDFAVQHILALETKLPRVVLHLPAESTVAAVDIDGEPLPATHWYLPLYLDPGEHAVAVSAPGKQRTTVSFRVTSSPTDQIVTVPALPDDPGAKEPGPVPAPEPRDGPGVGAWVALGVGAVGLVTGATFGVLALSKLGEAEDRCPASTCDAAGLELYRAAESRALVSVVGTGVGIAGAAIGGFLLFGGGSSKGTTVGLRAGPGAAQLALGGTF